MATKKKSTKKSPRSSQSTKKGGSRSGGVKKAASKNTTKSLKKASKPRTTQDKQAKKTLGSELKDYQWKLEEVTKPRPRINIGFRTKVKKIWGIVRNRSL